jgi:hypothetical protein
MWRRCMAALLTPLAWLLARFLPVVDPWTRMPGPSSVAWRRRGTRRDFGWYFEGKSKVRVDSLEDVQNWLDDCEYVSDELLFRERDFWQHPLTFEQLRRGDCEDFALWAWRKLLELDFAATFVSGRALRREGLRQRYLGRAGGGHAWVMFSRDDGEFVFEPTMGSRARAVLPLDAVRNLYVPELGVGPRRRGFVFGGYYLRIRERIYGRPEPPATE